MLYCLRTCPLAVTVSCGVADCYGCRPSLRVVDESVATCLRDLIDMLAGGQAPLLGKGR